MLQDKTPKRPSQCISNQLGPCTTQLMVDPKKIVNILRFKAACFFFTHLASWLNKKKKIEQIPPSTHTFNVDVGILPAVSSFSDSRTPLLSEYTDQRCCRSTSHEQEHTWIKIWLVQCGFLSIYRDLKACHRWLGQGIGGPAKTTRLNNTQYKNQLSPLGGASVIRGNSSIQAVKHGWGDQLIFCSLGEGEKIKTVQLAYDIVES